MKLRDFFIGAGCATTAFSALALSLGNSPSHVQLGSPIDVVFPLQADAGQTAQNSCVTANIWMGSSALNSSEVTVTGQAHAVRVQSTSPVYEPQVTIQLRAGCAGVVTRSYTFLADPPDNAFTPTALVSSNTIGSMILPAGSASKKAVSPQPEKAARTAPSPARPSEVLDESKPHASASATNLEPQTAKEALQPNTFKPVSAAAVTNEKPRLRIESLEGLDLRNPTSDATAASVPTETTALSDEDAETAAEMLLQANAVRLETAENQLQAQQEELRKKRAEIAALHNQLVQVQQQELPLWVYGALGLLAVTLAALAWLLQRRRQERRDLQASWTANTVQEGDSAPVLLDRGAPAGAVEAPLVAETIPNVMPQRSPFLSPRPSSPLPTPSRATEQDRPDLYTEFEQLAPHLPSNAAPAELSEVLMSQAMLDVQEQAEFFASIGENDQAIEILQSHIAQHIATAPLAYMQLLQLLYRLSRSEAFEQVREKFQTHFNVRVPSFMGFSRKGHDLGSGHHEVLSQIEAQWPSDDVQPLLRSLIVRNPSAPHVDATERFGLAAFDDLLMLYSVAQATPASSRGQLPGRNRTAPAEAPLSEIVADSAEPAPMASSPLENPPAPPLAPAILSMQEVDLDLLSIVPPQTPLSPPAPDTGASSKSRHFTMDETLVEGLSLDWSTAGPATPAPEATGSQNPGDLEDVLEAFTMDERDLPRKR